MIIAKKAAILPNELVAKARSLTPTGSGSAPAVSVDSALSTTSRNPVQNRVITSALNTMDAKVDAVGSGSPTVAETVAEMTDQTKVYLYTGTETGYTAGDWYYYDGTEWVDGGTYGEGGINTNARNLLKYILERVAYTETGMQTYVDALIEALKAGSGDTGTYSITYALTNVTSNNLTASVNEGDPYTCTLTPATDYTLGTVTVIMGGTDITSTAYSNGVVTIASVTGDVVITATAVSEWTWQYRASDGVKLSERTDIVSAYTTSSTAEGAVTEAISDGALLVTVTPGNNGYIYEFNQRTNNNALLEMRFKFTGSSPSTSFGGLQPQLSNGTGGAKFGIAKPSGGGNVVYAQTAIGGNVSRQPITENEWHTVRLKLENNKQSVYLDDVALLENADICTFSNVYNRIFCQNNASGQMEYFCVDYVRYKNNDL